MIQTLENIKTRYETLKKNVNIIQNIQGRYRTQTEINTLKEFIDNPNLNLDKAIKESHGERLRTFRWIAGDVV